jgi:hypothetical protein
MDEAPSTPKLLADHRPRLPGGQPPGWSGRPRGVLFAIAGRTGSQRFNGAGQRRGDPGLDPLGERPLGHAPRAPGGAISLFTCPCRGSIGHCATLPERLTARRPVLLAARMLARNKFLYSFSRPALRAAACGGRPRPAMGRRDRGTCRTVHEPSGAGSRSRCLRRSCSISGNSGRVDPGRSRSPWLSGLKPLGCRTDSSPQGDAAASPSRSDWTRRPERAASQPS